MNLNMIYILVLAFHVIAKPANTIDYGTQTIEVTNPECFSRIHEI